MSYLGKILLGGSRFAKWTLSPLVILFAILMPFLVNFSIEKWSLIAIAIMAGLELMCITLLMGFWLPSKISRWAFRVLAGLIFITYLSYLIYEYFFSNVPFKLVESQGEPSPRNALLGFVFIGIPSLYYSLFGRFTLRPPPEEPEIDKLDDNNAGDDID